MLGMVKGKHPRALETEGALRLKAGTVVAPSAVQTVTVGQTVMMCMLVACMFVCLIICLYLLF